MKKIILCKKCGIETNIHAQTYCHNCYKKLRNAGVIFKKHNTPNIITSIQHDLIIGSMLGDGWLRKSGTSNRSNTQFGIGRASNDEDYLKWEFDIMKNLVISNTIYRRSIQDKRTNKIYYNSSFRTMSCPVLNKYYNQWYPNNKKIVPLDLELNDRIMAIWFCDDGSIYYDKNPYILNITFATNGFSKDEVYFLRDKLINRYNEVFYVSNTYNNNNSQYLIGSSNDATRAVLSDIDPHIIGYMERKTNIWRREEARFYQNKPLRGRIEKSLISFILKTENFSNYDIANHLDIILNNKPMYGVYMPYIKKYLKSGFLDKVFIDKKSCVFKLTESGKLSLRYDPFSYIKEK